MKQKILLFISTVALATLTVVAVVAPTTHAAGWNAGNIISDGVFLNKNTMSAAQIQAFLNSKVPVCDTNGTQTSEHGGGTRAQWGAARGTPAPFICLKNYSENGKSAAQIIYDVAQSYNINPQVLIVLLQKEQGLITDTWPLPVQYRSATGYGCPDTAPCDSQYYGLTNQLTWASKMFKSIMTANPSWYTPYITGNNYIRYNPVASCGGTNVNIQNRATQALYNYTPYQPNPATLAAPMGATVNCGAYGNINFLRYFNSWFGSTETSTPYAWQYVSQNAYIDSAKTIPINNGIYVSPGQKIYFQVKAYNIGYRNWGENVKLGTSNSQDRTSAFSNSDWLSPPRATKVDTTIAPGSIGTFNFSVTAPQKTGSYSEYFNLVAEGETWMNDLGQYFAINVTPRLPQTAEAQLSAGQEIKAGEYLLSSDGHSLLTPQGDGNIVLYSDFSPSWASNTSGSQNLKRLAMQADGNLVAYDTLNRPIWSSGTSGNPNSVTRIQADGNLVIYSQSGTALWSSGTAMHPDYLTRVSSTLPFANLMPGQSIETPDRNYKFILQLDGNLVLYSKNKAVWASTTSGMDISRLAMQADGNLVLYSPTGAPLWHSSTGGKGQSSLRIQDDGNLVIYGPRGATWASNTRGM